MIWVRFAIVIFLILISDEIAKARSKPPYSPRGFINHINENAWSSSLFQYIDPNTSKNCYELKPLFGTWGGLSKGGSEIYFSHTKQRYVGPWGYGCFFSRPTTLKIGKEGLYGRWHIEACKVNYIYWDNDRKTFRYGYEDDCRKQSAPFSRNAFSFTNYMNKVRWGDREKDEIRKFKLNTCSTTIPGSNSSKSIYSCTAGEITIYLPGEKKRCSIKTASYTISGRLNYTTGICEKLVPFPANKTAFRDYLNHHIKYKNMNVDFISLDECSGDEDQYFCNSGSISVNNENGTFLCDINSIDWQGNLRWKECASTATTNTLQQRLKNSWPTYEAEFVSLHDCSNGVIDQKPYSCKSGTVRINVDSGPFVCDIEYADWQRKARWGNCRSSLPFEISPTGFRNYLNELRWSNTKEVFFHSLSSCDYNKSKKLYDCDYGNVVIHTWRGVHRCNADASYQVGRGATYSKSYCIKLDWVQQVMEKLERLNIN